jgi:hypothetical protein
MNGSEKRRGERLPGLQGRKVEKNKKVWYFLFCILVMPLLSIAISKFSSKGPQMEKAGGLLNCSIVCHMISMFNCSSKEQGTSSYFQELVPSAVLYMTQVALPLGHCHFVCFPLINFS